MPKALTERKVANIKILLVEGKLTQEEIAKKYRLSRSVISDIDTGRAWKKVPWPEGYTPKLSGPQRKRVPEYDPTDDRVVELEAEVEALRSERAHATKRAKASSKEHSLFRAVVEEMDKKVQPLTIKKNAAPTGRRKKGLIQEDLVMHLSDGHHDQNVFPHECGELEYYDFPTSVRRGERYVDTVLSYTQDTLGKSYKFNNLWILAYGDHTSGEIHGAVSRSYFRNQFKNSFAIGQLHGCMIAELSPYFESINIVYVPGNHGRRSVKKDFHGAHNNWDYVVARCAQSHCREIDNVTFGIPDAYCANMDINGIGFSIFHGDDVNSSLGVPWYGLEKRTRRVQAMTQAAGFPRIRYQVCGHFHKPGSLGDLDGEMIINGPWVATDAYAYNRFSGYTLPTQWFHGVNPEHGITWRMAAHLRNEKKYQEKPSRYQIPELENIN